MSPHLALTLAVLPFVGASGRADDARAAEAALLTFGRGSSAADRAALRTWERCGPAAVPALRGLLLEDSYLPHHPALLDTLIRAGGRAAVPVLREMLAADRVYWHNLGLNIDAPANVPAARVRRLEHLLRHFAALGGRDTHGDAAALHALFADHPIFRQLGTGAADRAPH